MLFSIQSQMFLESVLINWKGMEMIYSPPCLRPTNYKHEHVKVCAPHVIVIPVKQKTVPPLSITH